MEGEIVVLEGRQRAEEKRQDSEEGINLMTKSSTITVL